MRRPLQKDVSSYFLCGELGSFVTLCHSYEEEKSIYFFLKKILFDLGVSNELLQKVGYFIFELFT